MNTGSTDSVRAFLAVRGDEAVRHELDRIQRRLNRPLEDFGLRVKWVDPDLFHLTLLFFGAIGPEQADAVSQAMEKTVGGVRPLHAVLSGVGLFPKSGVIWVGVDAPGLLELQHRLAQACLMEPGKFYAHLTLGRIKSGRVNAACLHKVRSIQVEPVAFEIGEVDLMQSELRPDGPRYTRLHAARLGG